MTEMLGVLAVIAVLSIGGIAGCNSATTKYKSNTLMKDIDMRVVTLSAMCASCGNKIILAFWS